MLYPRRVDLANLYRYAFTVRDIEAMFGFIVMKRVVNAVVYRIHEAISLV